MHDVAPTSSRSRQRWLALAFVAALAVAIGFIVLDQHAPLSAKERMLVGHWYGVILEDDGRECMVLIEDYRSNREFHASAQRYTRESVDPMSPWQIAPTRRDDHVSGRWRGLGGAVEVTLLDLLSGPSLWKRLEILVREFRWEESKPEVVTFDVSSLQAEEKRFSVRTLKTEWTAVRVPEDFPAPELPVPAADVMAWWAAKQAAGRN